MKSSSLKTRVLNSFVVAGLLTIGMPASAHHSFYAEFDANKEVVLEGTVKEMKWSNPHSWIVLDIVNAAGETEEWMVEGGSPNVLMRLGWTRESLAAGTKVIIKGFGAKDGSHRASSSGIEFPDGRVLDTGGSSR
ncbi:MAG: DUF6152 family protein [Pseudomonadota bacterium]